ncbi:MAG: radical SAM protein [Lachnospiraceae bacterium]|nr:radical SAM protein [Lachnospiraceae bacterium]
MHYTEPVFRPPQEANTPLLEITAGCTHSRCRFCNLNCQTKFRMAPLSQVEEDLKELSLTNPHSKRIFFLMANAFALSYDRLMERIDLVHKYLPEVTEISMQTRVQDIKNKTPEQLRNLYDQGIHFLYTGFESGDDETLAFMDKNCTAKDIITQTAKLDDAGIGYQATFLNGVGGKELSRQHAINSGKVFSQIHPTDAVWITSLVLLPDTKFYQDMKEGRFTPLSEIEMLEESKLFLENLDIDAKIKGSWLTTADIRGEFPRDKQQLINNIQYAIHHIDESKAADWRSQIRYI